MKLQNILSVVTLSLVVVGFATLFWWNSQQPKIAYVHSNYLFENYLGTIESYKELEAKTKTWGNNLDSLSKTYRATFASYEAKKAAMPKQEQKAAAKQLESQQQQFQQYHQAVEQQKSTEDQKLTQAVIKQMDAYIKAYALEHGYDLLIGAGTSGDLIYGSKAYDVTDEVLEYINKKYKGQ